jgi:hypothetical protein
MVHFGVSDKSVISLKDQGFLFSNASKPVLELLHIYDQ